MRSSIARLTTFTALLYLGASRSWAGTIYQNFEPNNGAPLVLTAVGGAAVQVVGRAEAVHYGVQAVKVDGTGSWIGFGVQSQVPGKSVDIRQANNDRLTFWVYALPKAGNDNNVGVTFYDNANYLTAGFEVWTTQTARYGQWSKLKILYSQLPSTLDLSRITRIEFKNFWPGVYYVDDIHAVREDRVYQSFEKEERSGTTDSDYGWKWNGNDTVATTAPGEPLLQGNHSWKLISTAQWGGTGIQSQEQGVDPSTTSMKLDFWHVDLNAATNDRLTFWIYGLPANEMDNNVQVQFYDNGNHFTDATKVSVWTKISAVNGRWTRLTAHFSDVRALASDFQFHNVNKIQLQCYWPGTYYFDDLRATGPQSQILESSFAGGTLAWKPVSGAAAYRVQESLQGPSGPWRTIYAGPATQMAFPRLAKRWLRVRWEEDFVDANSLPYSSEWSDAVEYMAPAAVLSYSQLSKGTLVWNSIPQATKYEVQRASLKSGPWSFVYKGSLPFLPLKAKQNTWYRVRAVRGAGETLTDVAPWSRPQRYAPGLNYVRANGTVLREDYGNGAPVVLSGVNLGGAYVIEPWMTGLGNGDNPSLPDDWSIRDRLATRFGTAESERLMQLYQQAYLSTFDFDRLVERGITLVRLPFYYRNFQDDNGQWLAGEQSFAVLDSVVNALSDRGIYVILDMHGAPGLQSADATTGRAGFNQLFSPSGDVYRKRTEDLWRQIAKRYRDNAWVLGFDLLNEPLGSAPKAELLANVYDRIYRAIRTVDLHHLIIMEGIWYPDPRDPSKFLEDWDTLPPPQHRRWTNVMYQFHFYHWDDLDPVTGQRVKADENFPSHKAFIDAKLAAAALHQPAYKVPVMIGEFYGFNMKSIWDYYLTAFNSQQWSWTSWSYKYHDSPSSWGVFSHAGYDESLPDFSRDSSADLQRKLTKYATADYHAPSVTLTDNLQSKTQEAQGLTQPAPLIASVLPRALRYSQTVTIQGARFGAAQNRGSVRLNGYPLVVNAWGDRVIQATLTTLLPPGLATLDLQTDSGLQASADLLVEATPPSPVLQASTNNTFTLLGSELGDTPGTFQFYALPCSGVPPTICNQGFAGISHWSSTSISGYVPPDAADLTSRFTLHSVEGGELYPTMR